MNYLAQLPPKKRFYAALTCLPLIYFISQFLVIGLEATHESGEQMLMVGAVGVIAAWNLQRIAALIVTVFEKR